MDSGISVTAVTTPALFTGPPEAPAQVVRVRICRDRPAGPPHVTVHGADHTRAPWTLDSPRLNRFALSEPLARPGRALGAGEIVLPDAGTPDGLRELVTALGRHGVTATPTRPAGPRWGDLAADSSLPDFRIALGGPAANAFTAAVPAAADPAYAQAVREHARVWFPARAPLRALWSPGCDLTGVRDLPVLVHTGSPAELARAVGAAGRLEAAGQPAEVAAREAPYVQRTVGILVRGTPGFAVDTAGRLRSTLMRSCTGRPSEERMAPPRCTAPDGSSFRLQHWTHVFEHALVAGEGGWRELDLPHRGREFNKPLTAVTGAPAPGPQPGARSLLGVEPPDRVLVESVKRAGAGGLEGGPDGGLAVRLRETHGRAVEPEVRAFGRAAGPTAEADLLDRPRGAFGAGIRGAATTTLLLPTPSGMPLREGEREPQQPVFSRYWLRNTGTAPLGNAPYTLTCDGIPCTATVTLASHGGAGGPVALEVRAPDGWHTSWTRRAVDLAPGGHERIPLSVVPAPGAGPGEHLVRILATTPAGCPRTCCR
ncbi:NEW3 domain-containing protein [Streptomyces sp. NPDC056491]|uniref:NEW3 domain-containing protein n=1 Tax=Streptomyces sp. NPDC056491 TaxID=3345837 RepID=UPI0036B56870